MAGGEPENERAKNENLRKAFSEMERVGSELDLPVEVIEFAESTYRQVLKIREEKYWNIDHAAMSTLYVSAKVRGEPIQPDDITSVDRVSTSRKALLRRSKKIMNLLSLDIGSFYDTSSYVDQICGDLEVDGSIRNRAHEIIDLCSNEGIAGGKKPSGWAAAAVYNAVIEIDKTEYTQHDIADVAGVSEVTIRNRYQEQREVINNCE